MFSNQLSCVHCQINLLIGIRNKLDGAQDVVGVG